VVVPSLRFGQIVIWDNLDGHMSAKARTLIEAAGCHLVFLPPYVPDFNPIEPGFAKIKQALQRRGARWWDAVVAAVAAVRPAITAADVQAFFTNAGFPNIVQELCTLL
jgi:putative transposase